jgi:hypothetical protein
MDRDLYPATQFNADPCGPDQQPLVDLLTCKQVLYYVRLKNNIEQASEEQQLRV